MKEAARKFKLLLRSSSAYALNQYGREALVGTNEAKQAAIGDVLFSDNIQYCTAMMLNNPNLSSFWLAHFEMLQNRDLANLCIKKIIEDCGVTKFPDSKIILYQRHDPFGSMYNARANTELLAQDLQQFGIESQSITHMIGPSPIVIGNGIELKEFGLKIAQRLRDAKDVRGK